MGDPNDVPVEERLFWKLAEPLIAGGLAERGTMMGFPCLRVDGKFFASLAPKSGHLIVKLPAERVRDLVAEGRGMPFAPSGRVFREWVAVDRADESEWASLLREARAFALGAG